MWKLILLLLFVSCIPTIRFDELKFERNVVVVAYSEESVEMMFRVIGEQEIKHYYLKPGDLISDTLTVHSGEVVNWVDRSHKNEFFLWYKLYQVGYENEASEVLCTDNCLGEATGLKVK